MRLSIRCPRVCLQIDREAMFGDRAQLGWPLRKASESEDEMEPD
jgi:hypothetical protein